MENFVFPDEIKTKLMKMSKKPLFPLPHHSYMKTWIKLETTYKPPQGSHLFVKGSFVIFYPANLESIGNKDRVSSSVIQRSPIIIVVGWWRPQWTIQLWDSSPFQCIILNQSILYSETRRVFSGRRKWWYVTEFDNWIIWKSRNIISRSIFQ